jgi:hypothetical protein
MNIKYVALCRVFSMPPTMIGDVENSMDDILTTGVKIKLFLPTS